MAASNDSNNPTIYGTQKEYAWNAWQTRVGVTADRNAFNKWWEGAVTHSWASLRDLMLAAWNASVGTTPTFEAWWQEIIDSQPVTK